MAHLNICKALSAAALLLLVAGCVHKPAPAALLVRPGLAADVGPHLSNYSEATVPANGVIVLRSDDFAGPDAASEPHKGRPARTVKLADALAAATGLKVVDQSMLGETIEAAAERLKTAPVGDLLVICYGFGDAAATDAGDFDATLTAMIEAAEAQGAAVYLVVEPVSGSKLSDAVEAYRNLTRSAGAAHGAGVIDANAGITKAEFGPGKSAYQTPAAVKLIAGSLAAYLKIAPAG